MEMTDHCPATVLRRVVDTCIRCMYWPWPAAKISYHGTTKQRGFLIRHLQRAGYTSVISPIAQIPEVFPMVVTGLVQTLHLYHCD
jgi:hypothetical protein